MREQDGQIFCDLQEYADHHEEWQKLGKQINIELARINSVSQIVKAPDVRVKEIAPGSGQFSVYMVTSKE